MQQKSLPTGEALGKDGHSPQGDIYWLMGRRNDLLGFERPLSSSEREVLPGLSWSKPSKIVSLQSPVGLF